MIKVRKINNNSSYERLAKKYKNIIGEKRFSKTNDENTSVLVVTDNKLDERYIPFENNKDVVFLINEITTELGLMLDGINPVMKSDIEMKYSEDKFIKCIRINNLHIIGDFEIIERVLGFSMVLLSSGKISENKIEFPIIETKRLSSISNLCDAISIISILFSHNGKALCMRNTENGSIDWEVFED